ncbi:hypothetical protein EDB86DRAFT_2990848 [Lactarius hatsudake]|nr:hypothetical protein EDB86DRAFT_2990848 [Lactarius hatsudake]
MSAIHWCWTLSHCYSSSAIPFGTSPTLESVTALWCQFTRPYTLHFLESHLCFTVEPPGAALHSTLHTHCSAM